MPSTSSKPPKPNSFYVPHDRVITPVGEHSMTEQSHKDACDINNIVRQYQMTGIIEHIQKQTPIYTDLPDTIDFQSSMNLVLEAEQAFATLPSKVRDHYANDPARFLAALGDPKEADRLREWGVLKPLPSSTPLHSASRAEQPAAPAETKPSAPQ